jgi:hypothetical protein
MIRRALTIPNENSNNRKTFVGALRNDGYGLFAYIKDGQPNSVSSPVTLRVGQTVGQTFQAIAA